MTLPFDYPYLTTAEFGGAKPISADFEDAQVVVLPIPLDRTTSYVPGTRNGPHEILVASSHMELWDEETETDVHGVGIFTMPEISNVGLTEAQAKAQGFQVRAESVLFRNIAKPHVIGEIGGMAKIVFDGGSGRVLGVHLVGACASDLIAEGALAVKSGRTIQELADTIHGHPTLAEIMSEVSMKALGKPIHG